MVDRNSECSIENDRQNVGVVLIEMSDPHAILHPRRMQNPKNLSKYAKHFLSQIKTASYSYLFEVCSIITKDIGLHADHFKHSFLQQASAENRTWYLITHYLDTIACWGISTQHIETPFE
jgi:hypothetical protein